MNGESRGDIRNGMGSLERTNDGECMEDKGWRSFKDGV